MQCVLSTSWKGLISSVLTAWLILATPAFAAETVTYYYTDPQGTVLATADASGNVLSTTDYRPYGSRAAGNPVDGDGPGYTGHVSDMGTGLIYAQARYYDPAIGRFLSVDPLGLKDGDIFATNDFAYAMNNPIMDWDPSGLCAADQEDPSCPGDPPPPPPPAPITDHPSAPDPAPAQPVTLPKITVKAHEPISIDAVGIPPPIFRAPAGRPIFSRSIIRVLLQKADDAASNALVKKLSFRTLKISKTGFLKPTPITFGIWALTYSEELGGCEGGHCADEAPVKSLKAPSTAPSGTP